MACGSACCAPAPPHNITQSGEAGIAGDDVTDQQDSCRGSCCGGDKEAATTVAAAEERACNDGCCAIGEPLRAAEGSAVNKCQEDGCCADEKVDAPEVDDSCNGGCCAAEEATNPVAEACQDACCGNEQAIKEEPGPSCQDGCCSEETAPKTTIEELDADHQNACCSSGKTATKETNTPACCEGKTSPCCDISCLERLAGRECEEKNTNCNGKPPRSLVTTSIPTSVLGEYLGTQYYEM